MDQSTIIEQLSIKNKIVCIIGAGISGMVTAKSCLEYGIEPVVYERTKNLGGLWRFRELVEPGQGSVMRSTVVNSSKVMTAFSDYPFPDDYPNFMPNELMVCVLIVLIIDCWIIFFPHLTVRISCELWKRISTRITC